MELFGTAILVLSVQISLGNGSQVAPLVVALVFVAIVYAGFPISGGHFNPAITFSVFLRGKLSFHEMLSYWIFQVGGGFCGALLGAIIVGNSTSPAMGKGYFFLQAFLAELVFTAVICFVVLAVSTNCKVEGNSYYGRKLYYYSFFLSSSLSTTYLTIYISNLFLFLQSPLALLSMLAWRPQPPSAVVFSTPPLPLDSLL